MRPKHTVFSMALALGLGIGTSAHGAVAPMQLTSTQFTNGSPIPSAYTCDGRGVSPPLAFSRIPPNARSFALTAEDPDAHDARGGKRTFVHWVVYNLPASSSGLPEDFRVSSVPGAGEGINDANRRGYTGPCPPSGSHHYVFTLYALDAVLQGVHDPTKADLGRAVQGHVLETAQLVGTYERRPTTS